MRLTEEQAAAAQSPGSVAVTAGAGTGKTLMLAARFLHHVTVHGLSPLEVVAVTFTEKAAAELRARIRHEAAAECPSEAALLAELEAAPISTLHALAARICREHPKAAGVSPDFAVLDELEGGLWMAERLNEALDQLPASLYGELPYSRMREALEAFLADPIMAARALERGSEGWLSLVEAERERALEELLSQVAWREAACSVRGYRGEEGDLRETSRRIAGSAVTLLEGCCETPSAREEAVLESLTLLSEINLRGGRSVAWPGGGFEEVKEALGALRELAKACIKDGRAVLALGPADELLAALLPALREAFAQVRDALAAAKRRGRVLDFNDLEVHALQALQHAEVRDYYRERWKAFLVDEFQDTNPVQAEILERLTEGARVTLVGDEKQSIYGFRRADVTVFRRFREGVSAGGGELRELSLSFRTHRTLTLSLNGVFRPLLGDLHQTLSASREEPPHPAPHLRVFIVEAPPRTPKPERQLVEASRIAGLLREMLDCGVPVHERTTDRLRPIRPGDVAVLSRAWDPLETYGEALEASGIAAVHTGGGNLLVTREAADGMALLRFLADPRDSLSLVALLRGPCFAVNDRLLFTLARDFSDEAGPGGEGRHGGSATRNRWWELIQQSQTPGLARARAVLEELLRASKLELPSRLLQIMDRLTGYTAVLANLPGAARREADWSGFLALVRDLERGANDLFGVVRRLRRLLQAEVEAPRPPLETGDAVSLMTIHGSKGLEWPVVVVPDLTRVPPGGMDPVAFDPELGVALKVPDESGERVKPALYVLLEARKREREEAEGRRLLYVALTRARDALLLTAADGKGGSLELLRPGLAASGIPMESISMDAGALLSREPADPPLPPLPDQMLLAAIQL